MSELLEKIRSRGHWRVIIRPAAFDAKRVSDFSTLHRILQKTSVQRRGWEFPTVEFPVERQQGKDWIGREIDWEPIPELWRFYRSGQFVCYFGNVVDWDQHQPQSLPKDAAKAGYRVQWRVHDIITHYTSIFEFAARLAFTEAGDEGIHLEVAVRNLHGYYLAVNAGRPGLGDYKKANIVESPYEVDISRIELVAQTKDLALKPALELFQHFNWNPGVAILRDLQAEMVG